VVDHDCVVGEFAHLSPIAALGGAVHVGARTHLGLGAVALPGVRIGADVRVGAGAVVHRTWRTGSRSWACQRGPLRRAETNRLAPRVWSAVCVRCRARIRIDAIDRALVG
jgi:carbonic anhydrase/acetyltransferase-like protein (isoleucine patch superfamily)